MQKDRRVLESENVLRAGTESCFLFKIHFKMLIVMLQDVRVDHKSYRIITDVITTAIETIENSSELLFFIEEAASFQRQIYQYDRK